MVFWDFSVKYNPDTDDEVTVAERILYYITVRRAKGNMPTVMCITGMSGSGKSKSAGLNIAEMVLRFQGLNIYEYMDAINIYTPFEYAEKMDRLLHAEELKKVNVVLLHESKELVGSAEWQTFLAQAVPAIHNMSRTIKPLIIIIITQYISDITAQTRRTINYYLATERIIGHPARVYPQTVWLDDRNLERVVLRKRQLRGFLEFPDGRRKRLSVPYLEFHLPDKTLCDMFDYADQKAKKAILDRKIKRLINEMREKSGLGTEKMIKLVDFYTSSFEKFQTVGKTSKNTLRLSADFEKLHDLEKEEKKQFLELVQEAAISKGYIKKSEEVNGS